MSLGTAIFKKPLEVKEAAKAVLLLKQSAKRMEAQAGGTVSFTRSDDRSRA